MLADRIVAVRETTQFYARRIARHVIGAPPGGHGDGT